MQRLFRAQSGQHRILGRNGQLKSLIKMFLRLVVASAVMGHPSGDLSQRGRRGE
jgi:hypothetical protein